MSLTAEVIIPAYNAGPSLRRAVDSALALPCIVRVIVVDDGSSTPPELAPDPRLLVLHQPNAGPAAARNRGLDASAAQWIIFCDADDALLPAIADSLTLAESFNAAACVSGRIEVFPDGSRLPRPASEEWVNKPLPSPGLIFKPIALFGTPGLIVSRRVIQKNYVSGGGEAGGKMGGEVGGEVGGVRFDITLHHAEDRDFIRRIADLGPVVVSSALAVQYTKHPSDAHNLNAPRHLPRRIDNFLTILARHHDADSDPYFRESARWLINAASKVRVPEASWEALTAAFRAHNWPTPLKPRLRRLLHPPPPPAPPRAS